MKTPEIIAEAGSNHNGDPDRAKELVDLAAASGASSVKFQFIFAEGLYLPYFRNGGQYIENPVFRRRQAEELSETQWKALWDYASTKGIPAAASVFCSKGLSLLKELGAPYVKIASTDLTNLQLINQACSAFQRVIISTGMASLKEIDETVQFVRQNHPATDLELMHCVSHYPCPEADAAPQNVDKLNNLFDLRVGYSDHTSGNIIAPMAAAFGATTFEKHFTTDRGLPGFDHQHALEGEELRTYVKTVENAVAALQTRSSLLSTHEEETKLRARRGAYVARDLPAGHILQNEDLLFVRPSSDFKGHDAQELIGKKLIEDAPKYSPVGYSGDVTVVRSNWEQAASYWNSEMDQKGMASDQWDTP